MELITYIDRATGKEVQENPPGEGLLKFLYHSPIGRLGILPLARRKFISDWYGRRMSSTESAKGIEEFVDQYNINMDHAVKSIYEYTSFNDFFYRKLKPEARPIGSGIVSPGDGKLLAFETASQVNQFFIKGNDFTIERYLADRKLAEKYRDGALIILRLAPNDYHRYHFPCDGTPTKSTKIKGLYYSVSPYALSWDFARVFCQNKREYTQLKTEDKGDILLSPLGATMVGSIHESYTPETPVQKGDEMGYFSFGGSTIVMLTEPGAVTIDDDLIQNTRNGQETAVLMGEKIAI